MLILRTFKNFTVKRSSNHPHLSGLALHELPEAGNGGPAEGEVGAGEELNQPRHQGGQLQLTRGEHVQLLQAGNRLRLDHRLTSLHSKFFWYNYFLVFFIEN